MTHAGCNMPYFLTLISLSLGAAQAAVEPTPSLQLAPGVYALPSSDRFGSANLGWVVFADHVILVGAPHPELVARCLDEVEAREKKPVRGAVLTHLRAGEREAAVFLAEKGISILAPGDTARDLRQAFPRIFAGVDGPGGPRLREFRDRLELRDATQHLVVLDLGHAAGPGNAAAVVPGAGVLFAGELCANGPRAALPGSRTEHWVHRLAELEKLASRTVVPGFGSFGGPEILARQRRYLLELRRQVAYLVAQGRPLADILYEVRIEPEWLVWMPYDQPRPEDIEHVHSELTVPRAPFALRPFSPDDTRPRALALIADRFHEPAHIEAALAPVLERAGVDARFTVDVRALTAENLKQVQLLVILRDGMLWPRGHDQPYVVWMAPEQERAVVDFVEAGGGLLALHNSMGLYPEGGPYLKLAGGTYQGHGPLERFRVRVVDSQHPVTRGVTAYEVADEQHTPRPDAGAVHPILESRSDEGVTAAAGWVREVKKGRVCHLANGHTREALLHPMVGTLIENAIRWCLPRQATRSGS